MRANFPTEALERAWRPARVAGVIGSASVEEIVEHTAGFLSAVCSVFGVSSVLRCLDVGSGPGIPGLLLAWELPKSSWTLLDSSLRRCEFGGDAVVALDLSDRVQVVHGRSDEELTDVPRATMDVVTARLLGSPAETLELCAPYCRPGGLLVVSIASRDRRVWESAAEVPGVDSVVVSHDGGNVFARMLIGEGMDPRLPRRPKARARRPLLSL
ncbi:MAG: hypothetical protein HOJ56_13590 [Acidimicrobiaceae bacterium]|nr:hypothetical protein [Acidimicrobiaceae bacterium]